MRNRIVQRRGIALLLVLMVVGAASVMGFAMLASSSMQAQVSSNIAGIAEADLIADSAVETAMYYLHYPEKAPSLNAGGYWPGGTDLTLASELGGKADIAITRVAGNIYDIYVTGKGGANGQITRSANARVRMHVSRVRHAAAFNGDITWPTGSTINGPVYSSGRLTLDPLAVIVGDILAKTVSNIMNWTPQTNNAPALVPNLASRKDYRTYEYEGQTYTATQLTTHLNSTTKSATATNPAGVYWYEGNLNLTSNVTINGTLIVRNGKLTLSGSNNTITPKDGMPALIVDKTLEIPTTSKRLTANGLVWLGEGVDWTGLSNLNSQLTINGALLLPETATVDRGLLGKIVVNHTPENVEVLDLITTNNYPRSVQVLSWNRLDD